MYIEDVLRIRYDLFADFICAIFRTSITRVAVMKLVFTLFFSLLFAFPVFAQTQTAEVVVPSTFLRKSPNSGAEKIETVQKGVMVTLEKAENTNGWYYVSIAGGKKGWINGNTISSPVKTETETAVPSPTPTPKPASVSQPAATKTPKGKPTPSPLPQQAAVASTPSPTPTVSITPKPTPPITPTPTPEEEEEVLRIETEEVNLNVRVIDSNNRPVDSLKESQFRIFEDNEPQKITSFSTAEIPTNYALVIDNSRSLRSQLEKVIDAGKILVSTNRPNDKSTVVRFVSADKIEVMRDFTSNKSLLNDALNNLFIEGGQTAIIDAVYNTAKRVDQYEKSTSKDDFKRRAMIVISDGDDRSSVNTEKRLIDLLRQSEVQIYAIGFVGSLSNQLEPNETQSRREKAKVFLTRLAEETGGKVYFPGSIDELPQIANEISGELRTQYLITYAPTSSTGNESFRNIKVTVADGENNEKRTAVTRTGRTAAPKRPKE